MRHLPAQPARAAGDARTVAGTRRLHCRVVRRRRFAPGWPTALPVRCPLRARWAPLRLPVAATALIAVLGVVVYGLTSASSTVLAAQLALDHLKCVRLVSPGDDCESGAGGEGMDPALRLDAANAGAVAGAQGLARRCASVRLRARPPRAPAVRRAGAYRVGVRDAAQRVSRRRRAGASRLPRPARRGLGCAGISPSRSSATWRRTRSRAWPRSCAPSE